jgi:hypothetical protein
MKLHANEVPHLPLMAGSIAAILFGTFVIAAVMAWTPGPTDVADIPFNPDKPAMSLAGQIGMEPRSPPVWTEEDVQKGVRARARIRAKAWAACAECGFVASMREFEHMGEEIEHEATGGVTGNPTRRHEVIIRMNDGTSRTFVDTHPANWRPGERVIFIEGANRTNRTND